MSAINPYKDLSTDLIYNMLFCDNIELSKSNVTPLIPSPYNMLFGEESSDSDLQKVIDDKSIESRIKLLAYNRQITNDLIKTIHNLHN